MFSINSVRHKPPRNQIASVGLDNYSFTVTGSAADVGNVLVPMTNGPNFSGVVSFGGGSDDGSFQLTNSGVLPCKLQALAGTLAGTYSNVRLTATQGGISNSPFTAILSPIAGIGAGIQIATLILANESVSSDPAGTPTQTFGWIFADSDSTGLPIGKAPRFVVSGVDQPFSASVPSMRRYYPSGRVMFCAISIRKTFALTGSATQAVQIWNDGSWPTMGAGLLGTARSLSDVYAQGLTIQMPSAPITNNGFGGANQTWGVWVNNTTNAANLIIGSTALAPLKDMDGDAGTRWRLTYNMSQTNGGSAHGQLICDVYVMAMTDGSGNLGGFRWCGYVRQPFYDVNIPAKSMRAFATPDYVTPSNGPNWSASGVSATTMGWRGGDGNPMTSKTASASATTVANNFYFGCTTGWQSVPVYLTGSVPANMDTTSVWMCTFDPSSNSFAVFTNLTTVAFTQITPSGGGTYTMHPVPISVEFSRCGFKSDNGRYLFFKGTGSLTNETTARAQIDRAAWLATGLLPPWDYPALKSIHDGGTVPDTTFTNLWNPMTIGSSSHDESSAGDHLDIGSLPNEAVLDFFNQSAISEKSVRCFGETPCLFGADLKDSTTGTIVNLSANNYTGMPASNSTIYNNLTWNGTAQGFTQPPEFAASVGLPDTSGEHRPQFAIWPWLRFGELQYWDFSAELGNLGLLQVNAPSRFRRNCAQPNTCIGTPLGVHPEYRTIAWNWRDAVLPALFGPYDPTNPTAASADGTLVTKYYVDMVARSLQRIADIFNPANGYFDHGTISDGSATTYITGGSTAANVGRKFLAWWDELPSPNAAYLVHNPEWEYGFITFGFCWALALGDANANYILNCVAQRWGQYLNLYVHGGWDLPAYYNVWGYPIAGQNHFGSELFNSKDQGFVTSTWNSAVTVSWDHTQPANQAFQMNSPAWSNSYTPGNGDYLYLYNVPGGPISTNTTTPRIVNWTGSAPARFGLSLDGVNAVAPTDTNSITDTGGGDSMQVFGNSSNTPTGDWVNRDTPFGLSIEAIGILREACCWAKALKVLRGLDTGNFDSIITDQNARLSAQGFATFNAPDARYAVKPSF